MSEEEKQKMKKTIEKLLYKVRLNKRCRKCNFRIECIRHRASCWHHGDIKKELHIKEK